MLLLVDRLRGLAGRLCDPLVLPRAMLTDRLRGAVKGQQMGGTKPRDMPSEAYTEERAGHPTTAYDTAAAADISVPMNLTLQAIELTQQA